jgi:hypothetical protein
MGAQKLTAKAYGQSFRQFDDSVVTYFRVNDQIGVSQLFFLTVFSLFQSSFLDSDTILSIMSQNQKRIAENDRIELKKMPLSTFIWKL